MEVKVTSILTITVKWGVIFRVLHGAWLKSKYKKDEHYTGGHQYLKSGGQWPPFWHFVTGRSIWPTFWHFAISSGVLFNEYFYQVSDTTLMLPEITKVCKVEVNMISFSTFCLWSIVEQHIILGVLGCLTHILDHNRCTLYRMSLLNEKWRSKWRQCSHSIYKEQYS